MNDADGADPDAIERVRERYADLAPALARTWAAEEPWRFVTDLTAIGSRMAGSDGERRAAELVADAFDRAGLREVRTDPFELTAWERGGADLRVGVPGRDGTERTREFEALALPYSPSETVEGELVDVGYGTPEEINDADVAGRVAVASTTTPSDSRFVHRMETFGHAVEAGAAGFVFVNHLEGQLPPTGSLTFGEPAAAPAAGVSAETGDWLREYAANADGPVASVELAVEASFRSAESRNVIGRVGPDTDERLLLLAHYDGHDIAEAALDNGCGIATVVTAAGILSEAELPVGVDVVAVACEEVGLLGAERLAETIDLDAVRGVINVDGAGRFRDLKALTHTSETARSVASAVSAATRQPIEIDPDPHPFSDQWPFVRRGIPALQLHSDSGERGRGWGHTHADTRDKVDDRNVREHAMLTALLVAEFAAGERDPERIDPDALADAFRETDFETGMRAADLWPTEWE
ncbi:Zn-dependent amino-or carboxypeptidase, M28 family [Halorubrum aquaticum]|uniref:Carboxypeptidase Q n=1 Tax=Halorubrum aquaticum TaxID=387340 RepID=A0A1I2ZHB9_9EURY|nr:M28 family metallopeptidase [Halorubrum aquaticum]SFH36976.1 Zn-dependent amino-or carboxypeptidase, M28 family [Halorubrum aquaticum]